jgi:hypothetical protein
MQTIFVAAPGFQSIDSWLPLALKHGESTNDEIFIVFPYPWILELIPESDSLVRIIADSKFQFICKFFPFQTYVVFDDFSGLMSFVRMTEHLKLTVSKDFRSKKTPLSRLRSFQIGLSGMRCLLYMRRFKFDSRGVMVWDILNLNPEPYKQLRSLISRTKLWKRISINVGSIYVEDVSLTAVKPSILDYQVSFSEHQTKVMSTQYGFGASQIIESTVPKFKQTWIEHLEAYSVNEYRSFGPYAFLVSRGADPPLFDGHQRLNVLEELINQICEVRKISLLIKLHPNERQDAFILDLAQITKRGTVSKESISRVTLVQDNVIVVAKYAMFGFAYYSSTVADMVRVGCPAIQVLPTLATDSDSLIKKKMLFDFGFVEIVTNIEMLSGVLKKIEDNRDEFKSTQSEHWSNYFFSKSEFSVSDVLTEDSLIG